MDPAKLKVVELRAQLSQRGLDTKGKKEVLVERLRAALDEESASREQTNTDANEDAHDAKENSEGRTVQPPKTPARASRSSSITTPTKISTRSGPRTPNSLRQQSPIKAQPSHASCEVLPTISESVPEDKEERKKPETVKTPENTEEKQTRGQQKILQNEVHASPPKSETKPIEPIEEEPDAGARAPEVVETPESSTLDKVPAPEPPEEPKDLTEEKKPPPEAEDRGEETIKETVTEEKVEKIEEDVKNDDLTEDLSSKQIDEESETCETSEKMECDKEDVKGEEEQTKEENKEEEKDESKDISSPADAVQQDSKMETEELEEKTQDQAPEEKIEGQDPDKTDPDQDLHEEPPRTDDPTEENQDQDPSRKDQGQTNNPTEDEPRRTTEEAEQDVEMTEELSEERKAEEEQKQEVEDREEKREYNDRKRKRSVSPTEDREVSPVPVIVEDEPQIDETALTLSWYDSDLNLVIDKDGFFTATPMHTDEFSQLWAGARASYGFLSGKVYYEAKIVEHCPINSADDRNPHMLRIGWSTSYTSMQLGEEKFSYGYDNTGKKSTENEFTDYGPEFDKNDVIGCYLDATSDNVVTLSYTLNGKDLGIAFTVSKEDLGEKPLFPHILSKNCTIACNFGQENPWSEEILPEYVSIGNVEAEYKVPGPRRSEKKEDCEVIMMCGLPASGKTTWATKYAAEHPQKLYNVLGIENLIQKTKHMGLTCKETCPGSWESLIEKCTRALNKLLELAATRRRNYILDQTNVYPSAQRRKMKNFSGYQRKAVVIVPTEEEFKSRATKHKPIEGKEIADSELMEMKANFNAPIVGEYFETVDWIELNEEEGKKLIEKYNKEGRQAGFEQQQPSKRARVDRSEGGGKDGGRDGRHNRDNRDHRRNNYQDRNRNPMWRGAGNMGWRNRQRGSHIRHGGGYGPPVIPWRGRAPIPPPHRGMDRRGISDRRPMNDRSRPGGPRQGGRGPMSGYQGFQQGGWNQQGNWSGGQSSEWGGQQGGRGGGGGGGGGWGGQQWDNWKGYGQGSYGQQTNYNQQGGGGYGNGNWNNWNQQYYNQYWDQQQQTGQTTAAGGGQAACTTGTTDSSSNLGTNYSYPQD